MNQVPLVALAGMLSISSVASAEDEFSYTAIVGADMWWGSTKLNEVRQSGEAHSPSLYLAFEHNAIVLPNASFRYTSVDSDSLAFDKYDYTLYYTLFDHHLMNFDAGVTFTQYSNSHYIEPQANGAQVHFDEWTWSLYGNAEINIPNSQFDIIGTIEFGDSNDIKSTDFIAGVQYRLPIAETELAFRGGYRVIDLDSRTFFSSEVGKEFVMVDGWFAGAYVRF
ncbi:TIGR04219 family outer membrane beta-barrel protein [uncultured Vibrio sp.]|uniref:TIGR04219 family outer membrane beta-barrel protein n=1 Tax=uncultured Vibrio sp. TaxID=114054 RepID=UPI00262587ED|nr:TIGR04219 family outer membrane beta-barrel protein [uncultured Vibrio sp.]